ENELRDVKKQDAIYRCQNCLAPKDQLTDTTFERIYSACFHHITKEHFIELQALISQGATKLEIKDFTKHNDHHLQTPQDVYHAVASKIQRLLECTLNLLNENGKNQFLKYWQYFEKLFIRHCMPNSITHLKSFMFSNALQLFLVMPFILRCFLTPECIILNELTALCDRLSSSSNDRRRSTKQLTQNDLNHLQDQHLQPLLMRWYITEDLYPKNITEEETGIISEDSRIINIRVQQRLTNSEIQSSQLTSHFDNNTALKNSLFAAYNEYIGQCRYIKTQFIKLYR
ncbi:845_t:CDS:2, partial [Cetraspora pellucida]